MKKTVLILAALIMSFGAFAQNVVWSFGFEDGMEGWAIMNPGAGVEVTQDDMYVGEFSLKVASNLTGGTADAWSVQVGTPTLVLEEGHNYKLSFWAKSSSGDGVARISTTAGQQLGPNDGGSPSQYWADFAITSEWTEFYNFAYDQSSEDSYKLIAGSSADATVLCFDMGTILNMVYYLDEIELTDLDATSMSTAKTDKNIAFGAIGEVVVKVESASIFDFSGRLVANAVKGGNALPAGLYIVKANGQAQKVAVK